MTRSNNIKTWASLFLCGVFTTSLSVADDSIENKISQLEEELNELKTRLDKPGVELKKGSTFDFGGYIRVDSMMHKYSDQNRAGNIGDEILVPSLIAVGDGSGGGDTNFDSHVKTSRIWFKTTTPTDVGSIKSYVELDFFSGTGDERLSNSTNPRIRHAFFSWGYRDDASLLVGQTWSTFFNVGVLPETLDFVGPTSGSIFMRQNQVRWTKSLGDGRSFMASLENPSTGLYDGGAGVANNNYDNNSQPDVVLRYNGKADNLAYSVSGVIREIAYQDGGLEGDDIGFGLNVAGKYSLGNGDDIKWMASYGNLGRYIALQAFRDGAIDVNGDIDLVDVVGGYVGYRHFWSKKLRSTVSYAFATADNPTIAGNGVTETVSNTNINLIYSPTPALSFGAEYILADRELESGVDGDLKRLQISAKYNF